MDTPLLCICDAGSFWPSLTWADFDGLAHKEETVVVVPVVGLADWGLGHPLDLEEVVLCSVLKEASAKRGDVRLLVIPPVRFVVGPEPGCAFAVSPPVACALLTEIVLSVKSSGFTRVVLLNSSPWNEELCDAVARDLRIEHGLQMFCIFMSGLGLDLHPVRGRDRGKVGSVFTAVTGTPSGAPAAGAQALESASSRLALLLREISERPPLRDAGRLGAAKLP